MSTMRQRPPPAKPCPFGSSSGLTDRRYTDMSLADFAARYSSSCPVHFAVTRSSGGGDQLEGTFVATGDTFTACSVKPVKTVVLKDRNDKEFSLPLTSEVNLGLIYDPNNSVSEACFGYTYETVQDVIDLPTKPNLLKATASHVVASEQKSVEKDEILMVRDVTKKKKLKVYSLTKKVVKKLPRSCVGRFTTAPHKVALSMTDLSENLSAITLPVNAVPFVKQASGYRPAESVTICRTGTENAVVSRRRTNAEMIELLVSWGVRVRTVTQESPGRAASIEMSQSRPKVVGHKSSLGAIVIGEDSALTTPLPRVSSAKILEPHIDLVSNVANGMTSDNQTAKSVSRLNEGPVNSEGVKYAALAQLVGSHASLDRGLDDASNDNRYEAINPNSHVIHLGPATADRSTVASTNENPEAVYENVRSLQMNALRNAIENSAPSDIDSMINEPICGNSTYAYVTGARAFLSAASVDGSYCASTCVHEPGAEPERRKSSCGSSVHEPGAEPERRKSSCGSSIHEPKAEPERRKSSCGSSIHEPGAEPERRKSSCGSDKASAAIKKKVLRSAPQHNQFIACDNNDDEYVTMVRPYCHYPSTSALELETESERRINSCGSDKRLASNDDHQYEGRTSVFSGVHLSPSVPARSSVGTHLGEKDALYQNLRTLQLDVITKSSLPSDQEDVISDGSIHPSTSKNIDEGAYGLCEMDRQSSPSDSTKESSIEPSSRKNSIDTSKTLSASAIKNRAALQALSCKEVLHLLDAVHLPQYKPQFERELVTGEVLLDCNEDILRDDLGVTSKLHRIRLMKLINGAVSIDKPI